MRNLIVALTVGLAVAFVNTASGQDKKVEVKGPHICCKQCVKVVGQILDKVEGVSDVNADIKSKTVTFTAKNAKAAQAGVKALLNGGFYGTATSGGNAIPVAVIDVKGEKANSISVKKVHVCCGQCVKAVNAIFKDAKVTIEGTGPQKTVTIMGNNLDPTAVLEALRKGGFNGTIEKK